MHIASLNSSITTIQMTIFVSFILTSSFVVIILACGGCKKKKNKPKKDVGQDESVTPQSVKDSQIMPEEETETNSRADRPPLAKWEPQIQKEYMKIETKSKSDLSKHKKKKLEEPLIPKETVGKREYATLLNVNMQMAPSVVIAPQKKPDVQKKKKTEETVDRKEYATFIGINNKLEASVMKPLKAKKTAIADVNYINTEVDEKKKPGKQQQPVTNYVEIDAIESPPPKGAEKRKATVDENQYATLQIANDKAMNASVIRNVGKNQYGTLFKIDDVRALYPTIVAKPKHSKSKSQKSAADRGPMS